jgi:hypothetical protein
MTTKLKLSILAATAVLTVVGAGVLQAQQNNMSFFVTSAGSGKGGDLGGLAGADAHCTALATAAGSTGKTWRAYLSSNTPPGGQATNARDRIGNGPWQNAKGVVVAKDVSDLHGGNPNINKETLLDEKGNRIKVRGDTPNQHDILTGSTMEGRAFPANLNLTCQTRPGYARRGRRRYSETGMAGLVPAISFTRRDPRGITAPTTPHQR